MTTVAILASGPSMTQALAESVRGRCTVIVVSDVYKIAPWADALVSNDAKWWRHHREAKQFAGRKFAGCRFPGLEYIRPTPQHGAGSNSGLQAMRVGRDFYGADLELLLGFDMHGTHFFGQHPAPLKNTTPKRRETHKKQFAAFDQTKCRIVNCTEGSALECFAFGKLEEYLQ